jgi:hypothetical protein
MDLPIIDLQKIIDSYNAATFKNTRDFDSFYIECNEKVYDAWELVSEIKLVKLTAKEQQSLKIYLEKLLPLATELLNILSRSDIETNNYNRFFSLLEDIEKEIPKKVKKLK